MEIVALLKRQPRTRCNSSASVDLPLPETPISTSTIGGTVLWAALSVASIREPFLVGIIDCARLDSRLRAEATYCEPRRQGRAVNIDLLRRSAPLD